MQNIVGEVSLNELFCVHLLGFQKWFYQFLLQLQGSELEGFEWDEQRATSEYRINIQMNKAICV